MAAEHAAPTLLVEEEAALTPGDLSRMLEHVGGLQQSIAELQET